MSRLTQHLVFCDLTQHNVFQVHLYSMYQCLCLSIHQLVDFGLFLLSGYLKKSYHQHFCPGYCVDMYVRVLFYFICMNIHLESKLLSHHSNYIHHFKDFQTIFQSHCTILYSHLQSLRDTISQNLDQHLLLSVFQGLQIWPISAVACFALMVFAGPSLNKDGTDKRSHQCLEWQDSDSNPRMG